MKEREYGSSYGESGYGNTGGAYDSSYGGYGNPFGGFGGFGGYGSYGNAGESAGSTDPHMQAAGNYVRSGHYQEALNVLNGISNRTALWYFYSAVANSGLGNNVTALEYAKKAVEMEPNNMQYQMYLNQLQGKGGWYQGQQSMYGFPMRTSGDFCMKLCLANLACNLCYGSGMCCGGPATGGGMYV